MHACNVCIVTCVKSTVALGLSVSVRRTHLEDPEVCVIHCSSPHQLSNMVLRQSDRCTCGTENQMQSILAMQNALISAMPDQRDAKCNVISTHCCSDRTHKEHMLSKPLQQPCM